MMPGQAIKHLPENSYFCTTSLKNAVIMEIYLKCGSSLLLFPFIIRTNLDMTVIVTDPLL